MTSEQEPHIREIEDLLADMRATPPAMPPGLAERVIADAAGLRPVNRPARKGRWQLARRWGLAPGGWPAVGGLVAAGCAGFWFGMTAPDGSYDPVALFSGQAPEVYAEAAELTGFGWDLQEW